MSNTAVPHRVPPYKRPIIIGGFLVFLALAIAVTVFVCKSISNSQTDPSGSSSGSSSGEQPPEASDPLPPTSDPEEKTPQFEGEDPNELSDLTGVIIYKDIDPETQTLHSAVSINQYLQADGQCVFNLKRDGATVRTASAVATADVTTSVCGPFTVSVADLSSGNYEIEVIVTGNDKRGIITDTLEL